MIPKLTRSDWEEIYYALESRARDIPPALPVADDVTPEDRKALRKEDAKVTRKWAAHLRRILAKIGPDGRNMTGGK